MFKTILVGVDGSTGADSATRYAIMLAQKLQARILALHVTDVRLLEGPWLADLSGALGAQPYPALLAQVREVQATRSQTILAAVTQQCQTHGVPCEVAAATGSLVHTFLEFEKRADLVVLGQRGEHAQWHADMLGAGVERMVRASQKPCLIVPEKFAPTTHILLAHDGSDESTKALHRGLNLAVALAAAVTIVIACPHDQEANAAKILEHARELALARGLTTHGQLLHMDPELAILQVATEVGANLIVMGAYGHTRIREWILGSTTSHVLRKARVPVLLARGE
ncbi:MAG: Universal stress protein [Verrucomicrobiae bacterium]|nr:Universal stress protein [Verrucomicrobiae bacterium]